MWCTATKRTVHDQGKELKDLQREISQRAETNRKEQADGIQTKLDTLSARAEKNSQSQTDSIRSQIDTLRHELVEGKLEGVRRTPLRLSGQRGTRECWVVNFDDDQQPEAETLDGAFLRSTIEAESHCKIVMELVALAKRQQQEFKQQQMVLQNTQDKLTQTQAQLATTKAELADTQKIKHQQQVDLEYIRDQLKTAEKKEATMKLEMTNLANMQRHDQQEVERLQTQHQHDADKAVMMEKSLASAKQQLQAQKDAYESLQLQLREVQQDASLHAHTGQGLKKQMHEREVDLRSEFQAKIEKLEQELETTQAECNALRDKNRDLREKRNAIQAAVSHLNPVNTTSRESVNEIVKQAQTKMARMRTSTRLGSHADQDSHADQAHAEQDQSGGSDNEIMSSTGSAKNHTEGQ